MKNEGPPGQPGGPSFYPFKMYEPAASVFLEQDTFFQREQDRDLH